MASQEPLLRSGLIGRAGLSEDIMTTWDRGGLFAPLPRRTPTARRTWPWHDANIAAVMMQLRQFGVPIDDMRQIAGNFRLSLSWMNQHGLTRDEVMALWNYFDITCATVTDPIFVADALALFRHERHGPSSRITNRIECLATKVEESTFREHLDAYLIISEQPEPDELPGRFQPDVTYFWRAGDQWKFARGESAPEQARAEGALATIAVDVSAVLYDVWNKPCAD